MTVVLDDVRPLPANQLVLDEKVFPIAPLKILAREKAIGVTYLDLTKGQDLTVNVAESLLAYLGILHRSIAWWIGDALNHVEETLPEEFSQLVEALGMSEQAARRRMFVCKQIPANRRKPSLGFSIHDKVARLDPKERDRWLAEAEKHQWTYATLVAEMKANRKDERPSLPGAAVDATSVVEAAQRVYGSKQEYGADWLVPREAMAVLGAALHEDEE